MNVELVGDFIQGRSGGGIVGKLRMNRGWARKFGPKLTLRAIKSLGQGLKCLLGDIRES